MLVWIRRKGEDEADAKEVFKEEDLQKEVNRFTMCEEVSMMRSESIFVECDAI